jgi:hypothetical protein
MVPRRIWSDIQISTGLPFTLCATCVVAARLSLMLQTKERKTMKPFVRMALLAAMLMSTASIAGAQVSFGIRIGPPPRPRVVHVQPARPGPDYFWVDGYWYPVNGHYRWHDGYWTRPPYVGAHWVGPHYDGQQFYDGYWDGDRGHFNHDHRWDRDRGNRDYDRDRDDHHDNDRH